MAHSGRPAAPRPTRWVPSGYLALGLAYVTVGSVANILFRNMGMSNEAATFWSSVVGIPYVAKPLWAPVLEIYRSKRFFVVVSQLLLAAATAAVALVLFVWGPALGVVVALLGVAALAGATQDIGCDGIYVSSLPGRDQARFAGVQSLFWNLGPILASGLFVRLSGTLHAATGRWSTAWAVVMLVISTVMLGLAAHHARALPPEDGVRDAPHGMRDALARFGRTFTSFFQKRGIVAMIAFAFFYRFGLGLVEKMGPLFMIDDRGHGGLGLSNQALGDINGTVGTAAFMTGSVIGGLLVARRGTRRSLLALCLCLNVSSATFVLLSQTMPTGVGFVVVLVTFEKLGWGVGCVGQMIYMMQQIAPGPYRTAHYTFATALMLLCLLVTGMLSGLLQGAVGYRWFFVIAMVATIPSLLVTLWAPFHHGGAGRP